MRGAMSSYWAFNGGVRASDADRERAVAALKRHYAAGRLETEELERRVTRAYAAGWRGELRSLQRDLPVTFDRTRVTSKIDRMQQAVYRAHELIERAHHGAPALEDEAFYLEVHAHPRLAALAQVRAKAEAAQAERRREPDLGDRAGVRLLPVEKRGEQRARSDRFGVAPR